MRPTDDNVRDVSVSKSLESGVGDVGVTTRL